MTRIDCSKLAVSICILTVVLVTPLSAVAQQSVPELTRVDVISSLDGESQPVLYHVPDTAKDAATPLFVFLHSWSGDYTQENIKWRVEASRRGWIYLHPNFRGANRSPNACGSRLARQDILDAMDYMLEHFNVDRERIYLAGSSGGGHISMLMAGHHPDRFSAVSAWAGISDLAEWYRFHVKDGVPQNYAKMIAASLGGPPGESEERDADYRDRSPVYQLHRAVDLPLEIATGVNDGHSGSVPIMHSLLAFNAVAQANGDPGVSSEEIAQLWQHQRLANPSPEDTPHDPVLGRGILLRRESKNARVTIFDGGHESVSAAACDWLSQHRRRAAPQSADDRR